MIKAEFHILYADAKGAYEEIEKFVKPPHTVRPGSRPGRMVIAGAFAGQVEAQKWGSALSEAAEGSIVEMVLEADDQKAGNVARPGHV